MDEFQSQWFVGASPKRASLFTLVAGAMFVAGVLLNEFAVGRAPGPMFDLGLLLLFLTLVLTAIQAYLNGSTMLALLLSVALPLGFVTEPILHQWHPGLLEPLHLGLAVGLLFGVTGHLIGAQLTTVRETTSEPSYRGQIALAVLMFSMIGLYFL